MRRKVEEHLKGCDRCQAERDDFLELKNLMQIKKYERPGGEYFEQLKSDIRRRIIARDIVSFKEAAIKFITQPSWQMTAVMVIALTASLSLNFFHYRNKYIGRPRLGQASALSSLASFSSTPSRLYRTPAPKQNSANTVRNYFSTVRTKTPSSSNVFQTVSVYPASMKDERGTYILKPIRTSNMNSKRKTRIFQ